MFKVAGLNDPAENVSDCFNTLVVKGFSSMQGQVAEPKWDANPIRMMVYVSKRGIHRSC